MMVAEMGTVREVVNVVVMVAGRIAGVHMVLGRHVDAGLDAVLSYQYLLVSSECKDCQNAWTSVMEPSVGWMPLIWHKHCEGWVPLCEKTVPHCAGWQAW